MSLKEFKKFCIKGEEKDNFIGSDQTLEKEIIRDFIIKPLSSPDKYFFLKILWGFISDNDLDEEILKILKQYVPNENEAIAVNGILELGDYFYYSDIVTQILNNKDTIVIEESKDYELDEDKLQDDKIRIVDIDDELDFYVENDNKF